MGRRYQNRRTKTSRETAPQDALPEAVLRRMLRGVSTRNDGVVVLAREGFGVRRSSVSRAFAHGTATHLRELCKRRFEGVRFLVIYPGRGGGGRRDVGGRVGCFLFHLFRVFSRSGDHLEGFNRRSSTAPFNRRLQVIWG